MPRMSRYLIAGTLLASIASTSGLSVVFGFESEPLNKYTLYRTGVNVIMKTHDGKLRIHVATFDADHGSKYNLANCEFVRDFFNANQPHYRGMIYEDIKVKYWCGNGQYGK
jgi:hypothetical protein